MKPLTEEQIEEFLRESTAAHDMVARAVFDPTITREQFNELLRRYRRSIKKRRLRPLHKKYQTAAWPPEKEAELRALAEQGFTGSVIAERMGLTRNAVLGKAGRMGLKIGRRRPRS